MVAATPWLAEALARDWRRAAGFCAKYEITETQFRHGVPVKPDEPPFRVQYNVGRDDDGPSSSKKPGRR